MKRMTMTLLALVMIVVPASVGLAQGGFSVDMPDNGVTIETSILWPIYPGRLVLVRAALPATDTGQALVGIQGRLPEFREAEGTFHNVNLHLGWRQHVGMKAEADRGAGNAENRGAILRGQSRRRL
ncbi:MAG TPA: hypothetical protein VKA06_06470 [Spirochaetia bacterium]|nr:hypothetical protein [Spirochaetia bacterium]